MVYLRNMNRMENIWKMKNGYFLCIKTSNKRINSIEKERMEYLYNSCICMKESGIWISSIVFGVFDKKDGS